MVEVGLASNANGTQLEPKNEDCDVYSVLGQRKDSSWRALNWVDFSWYVPTEDQRHSWDEDSDEFWANSHLSDHVFAGDGAKSFKPETIAWYLSYLEWY